MRFYLATFLLLISLPSMAQDPSSNIRSFAFRLTPHQDVKKSIIDFAIKNKIKAGCIVSAVGSLEKFHIRFANKETGIQQSGHFEVVSLTGTFSESSSHLHLSLSDSTGSTIGGHLLDNNLVYTTLEVVVAELTELQFERAKDDTYGYQELLVQSRRKNKK